MSVNGYNSVTPNRENSATPAETLKYASDALRNDKNIVMAALRPYTLPTAFRPYTLQIASVFPSSFSLVTQNLVIQYCDGETRFELTKSLKDRTTVFTVIKREKAQLKAKVQPFIAQLTANFAEKKLNKEVQDLLDPSNQLETLLPVPLPMSAIDIKQCLILVKGIIVDTLIEFIYQVEPKPELKTAFTLQYFSSRVVREDRERKFKTCQEILNNAPPCLGNLSQKLQKSYQLRLKEEEEYQCEIALRALSLPLPTSLDEVG